MSWEKLLADRAVIPLAATKQELDNLRSIVTRSLSDATALGLSADARFVFPYDAARTLSLMVVRAAGLFKAVQQFAIDAEAWIKAHHPPLA